MVAKRIGVFLLGVAERLEGNERLASDSLYETAGQAPVSVTFDQLQIGLDDLELDSRRATVENEDVHLQLHRLRVLRSNATFVARLRDHETRGVL